MAYDIPLRLSKGIHLRTAPEAQLAAIGLLKGGGELCLAIVLFVLDAMELISRHAHDYTANVVEAAEPHLVGVIADVDRHDVAPLGPIVGNVAFLATPGSVAHVGDLLVAAL